MSTPATQLRSAARTKAAIKRASAAARREANRLDARQLEVLERRYRRAAAEMDEAILARAGETGNLRLSVLEDLRGQVDGILTRLGEQRDALLDEGLAEAAELGVQPLEGTAAGTSLAQVPEEAVRFVRSFVAEDGLQLSDRLWRLDNGARTMVGEAIEQAVIQGHSASQAATDLTSRGEPVPSDVSRKIDAAAAPRVSRLAQNALLRDEGNARHNALRVMRTELNRAHGEAYMMGAEEHPDVIGFRFVLSPRHPRRDICDMHASANLHGLGPGVYPSREATPWPAHPNTLSYVEVVFRDDVTEADREAKTDRIEWLKKQPPGVQESVLNSRKKAAALRKGLLKENQIATPWSVLKERLGRQGVDVAAL